MGKVLMLCNNIVTNVQIFTVCYEADTEELLPQEYSIFC